jgi:CubicO group peptidase (beta-lactamase class C family)
VEERIRRIESAILPAVLAVGTDRRAPTLADRMKALNVPGVSIAVIRDGRIEWARGFGVTRIGGPPVGTDTLFQAASISKPVTAMAVLRLVQRGQLDLDADANRYLTSWRIPSNGFTAQRKVTLRQLITHTAGMTVHGFPGYASGVSVPTTVQVLNGASPANTPPIVVDTVPGTAWRYSGGGYTVVQQLLEDVTGTPFATLMRDSVLRPIGMTHSTFEQPLPASRSAEAATPYRELGQPARGGPHTYPEMAAAGLWTTASDLALLAIEIQKSLSGTSNRVLSAAMTRQMLTKGLGNYGLGWSIDGSAARPYFTHGGANEGFRSSLIAYNAGDGVVIMTNASNGGALAAEIRQTIAHEYDWPDFQPRQGIQDPRTEVALERSIDELRRGQPNYDLISAGLARGTRLQLAEHKAALEKLGALRSVIFKGVGAGGGEIYEVTFENGSTEWSIALSPDGRLQFLRFEQK